MLTEDEATYIVESVEKTIGEPMKWVEVDPRLGKFRLDTPVFVAGYQGMFRFVGTSQLDSWSFVFLGPGNERIRRISNPMSGHRNSDQSLADPYHKHFWRGSKIRDVDTYVPDDIRWEERGEAMVDFLQECGIVSLHRVPFPPIITSLPATRIE